MRQLDRRDFLKTGASILGAAALGESISTVFSKGISSAEAAGPDPQYEIYALKYAGPFTSKLAMVLWMEGWDQDIDR